MTQLELNVLIKENTTLEERYILGICNAEERSTVLQSILAKIESIGNDAMARFNLYHDPEMTYNEWINKRPTRK